MKRWLIGGAAVAVIAVAFWMYRGPIQDSVEAWTKPVLPAPVAFPTATTATTPTAPTSTKPSTVKLVRPSTKPTTTDPFAFAGPLPKSVNLAVPFLSQAPKMDWSMPYEEACEEASAIMVDAYYRGRTTAFKPDEGDKAILDLVAFEMKMFGYYESTTADEVARFIKGKFGYTSVVEKVNPTVDDLKAALANGYPVLIPADGKELENPNFRNGGPAYHMLVLKGYLEDGRWITDDPGTRKGADFLYRQKNIMDAMHDWNGGDVAHGRKVVLVVLPK